MAGHLAALWHQRHAVSARGGVARNVYRRKMKWHRRRKLGVA
jgi:hypothetical protein